MPFWFPNHPFWFPNHAWFPKQLLWFPKHRFWVAESPVLVSESSLVSESAVLVSESTGLVSESSLVSKSAVLVSEFSVLVSEVLGDPYDACKLANTTYTDATCPWQQEVSFEEAAASILIAEKIGKLVGDTGMFDVRVTNIAGNEVAITAGMDGRLCLSLLRAYGGTGVLHSSRRASEKPGCDQ